jgi:hypothetical protein
MGENLMVIAVIMIFIGSTVGLTYMVLTSPVTPDPGERPTSWKELQESLSALEIDFYERNRE